ncbi:MAG: TIGR01777 family oxidoreductase, partial [Bdellovibrionaceae bacterium]|nr:TIGR01777 family oxidoreductase [Pseudobdellovibrionaceae bacterium]
MRVLVTGATGLVGRQLGILLVQRGHKVYVLSRSKEKAKLVCPFPCEVLEGDLAASKFPSLSEIELDAVINLAGESVVGARWSEESKKEISRSRVDFTKNLVGSLKNIKKFISASAIGFYGEGGENDLTVSSPSDGSFLSEVCRQWEEEAFQARHLGAKVSCLRIGIVLSREGGALEKMLFPFKAGVAGALGSGQQWMSWIHIRDLVRLLVHTLENDAPPVINAVAPNPVRNLDFSRALAKVLGRWLG